MHISWIIELSDAAQVPPYAPSKIVSSPIRPGKARIIVRISLVSADVLANRTHIVATITGADCRAFKIYPIAQDTKDFCVVIRFGSFVDLTNAAKQLVLKWNALQHGQQQRPCLRIVV